MEIIRGTIDPSPCLKDIKENQKFVFLASKTSKKLIPNVNPYYFLEVGQNDTKEFSFPGVGLKGRLFKLLAKEIVHHGKDFLNGIYNDPKIIMDVLNKYRIKGNKCNDIQY